MWKVIKSFIKQLWVNIIRPRLVQSIAEFGKGCCDDFAKQYS